MDLSRDKELEVFGFFNYLARKVDEGLLLSDVAMDARIAFRFHSKATEDKIPIPNAEIIDKRTMKLIWENDTFLMTIKLQRSEWTRFSLKDKRDGKVYGRGVCERCQIAEFVKKFVEESGL